MKKRNIKKFLKQIEKNINNLKKLMKLNMVKLKRKNQKNKLQNKPPKDQRKNDFSVIFN